MSADEEKSQRIDKLTKLLAKKISNKDKEKLVHIAEGIDDFANLILLCFLENKVKNKQ